MRPERSAARRVVVALAIACAFLAGLPATATASHNSSSWSQLQKKIRDTRARIREAERKERGLLAQLAASDAERQRLAGLLGALGHQLSVATDNLHRLQAQAAQAQLQLDLATRELELALARLDEQTNRLGNRAAATYMQGPAPFVDVILGARDFEEFVVADQYVTSVLDGDSAALEAVRQARYEVEMDRLAILARKTALDTQVSAIEAQRNRLATIRAQREAARRATEREISYREVLLKKVRSEKDAYRAALRSYIAQSNSISSLLRGLQRGQSLYRGSGHGYLRVPVSGRISSPYGWRTHPIYGYRSFHTGIDIAAPAGRSVGAARSGEVVFVGYKGAYGLVVLIDHGYQVATMYAHLSKVYVRAGQRVSTLKTIAAVGCTGWCTGPHVHFEVRVGGEPRNPVGWF